jgi:hypothetical protein
VHNSLYVFGDFYYFLENFGAGILYNRFLYSSECPGYSKSFMEEQRVFDHWQKKEKRRKPEGGSGN